MTASNPSVSAENSNKPNWLSGCLLALLSILFGGFGLYDLIFGSLTAYIFFSTQMFSAASIAIILIIACDCVIYFVLAFRIKRQRWFVSLTLLAVVWLVLPLPFCFFMDTATMRVRSDGYSMTPALSNGDHIIADRQAYRHNIPQRGDLIIFGFPLSTNSDEMLIKRVIGLPGETIKIDQGQVLVNGVPLHEPYISEQAVYKGEWRIPEGQYFVLGDNRNESRDSHQFGLIPGESILAKAVWIYWTPSRFGKIPNVNFVP